MLVSTSANIVTNYKQIENEAIHIIEITKQIENKPIIKITSKLKMNQDYKQTQENEPIIEITTLQGNSK
jgi:hypothetical protein